MKNALLTLVLLPLLAWLTVNAQEPPPVTVAPIVSIGKL